ncbi:hypothetical protein C8J57DRAFT_1584872 [Mycena rebaudengoi]|nr:hypothetical protein C8J57DRAFT_1584872 [Mycena rebaudengoi]
MSSPSPSSDLDDVFDAMEQPSPVRPRKRPHTMINSDNLDGDDEDTGPTPPDVVSASGTANPNVAAAVMRFVDRKHLHGHQKTDVQQFLNDPPSVREGKSYAQALHIENLIAKIIVATPPWVPSADLNINIYSYAIAILLSTKLSAYKDNTPKKLLYAILKKHHFDLPDGIEHNAANWAKAQKAVQDALTQLRSKIKKMLEIKASFLLKNKKRATSAEQKNIFDLTTQLVEGTQCEVNVLCARVAFMRKSFAKDSSAKFWDTVDEDLARIRDNSDGDSQKITRAFRYILKKDRETYGVDDYKLEDTVDGFQQEVDDMIDANTAASASASGGDGAGEGGEGDGDGGDRS